MWWANRQVGGGVFVGGKAGQGAVEVDVCCVDEFHLSALSTMGSVNAR